MFGPVQPEENIASLCFLILSVGGWFFVLAVRGGSLGLVRPGGGGRIYFLVRPWEVFWSRPSVGGFVVLSVRRRRLGLVRPCGVLWSCRPVRVFLVLSVREMVFWSCASVGDGEARLRAFVICSRCCRSFRGLLGLVRP